MMNEALQRAVEATVGAFLGRSFRMTESRPCGGGCINTARIISDGESSFFVKLNRAEAIPMFIAEAAALQAMATTASIRVPVSVGTGSAGSHSFIVLEALEFGQPTSDGWSVMGRQLAALHRCTASAFGWDRDNTIGTTPQSNRRHRNWLDFFREERLRPQLERAARNGFHFDRAEALLSGLPRWLDGHHPVPSLLHGDLWFGNAAFLEDGSPVLFDPASYFGDREADLAFTECFGGFPQAFYTAYEAARPLPKGYPARKELYNLYHILNHANLFGSGYAAQADAMIRRLARGS